MPLIRSSSDTVTTRLTISRMYCHVRVSGSTLPPRPSAIVGFTSIVTRRPAARAAENAFDAAASTPITSVPRLIADTGAADNICARLHGHHSRRAPPDEATPADGHDHDIHRRPLLDDLHADGSSP